MGNRAPIAKGFGVLVKISHSSNKPQLHPFGELQVGNNGGLTGVEVRREDPGIEEPECFIHMDSTAKEPT